MAILEFYPNLLFNLKIHFLSWFLSSGGMDENIINTYGFLIKSPPQFISVVILLIDLLWQVNQRPVANSLTQALMVLATAPPTIWVRAVGSIATCPSSTSVTL